MNIIPRRGDTLLNLATKRRDEAIAFWDGSKIIVHPRDSFPEFYDPEIKPFLPKPLRTKSNRMSAPATGGIKEPYLIPRELGFPEFPFNYFCETPHRNFIITSEIEMEEMETFTREISDWRGDRSICIKNIKVTFKEQTNIFNFHETNENWMKEGSIYFRCNREGDFKEYYFDKVWDFKYVGNIRDYSASYIPKCNSLVKM